MSETGEVRGPGGPEAAVGELPPQQAEMPFAIVDATSLTGF